MPITPKQLEKRKDHIGGSDVPAILGVDPWRSAYDVWLQKTGRVPDVEETPAMRVGRLFEHGLLLFASEELGALSRNQYRSEPAIHLGSHIDGIVNASGEPVEAKYSTIHATEQWGEAGTDQVPDRVIVQCHAHMIAIGSAVRCHVAHNDAWQGPTMYAVPRNDDLVDAIKDACEGFWIGCVKADTPPTDSAPSLDIIKRARRTADKLVTVDPQLIAAWQNAKDIATEAEDREKRTKAELIAAMGDGDAGDGGEAGSVTFFEQGRKGFNAKGLREDHPTIAAQYEYESRFRVLRFKKAKG